MKAGDIARVLVGAYAGRQGLVTATAGESIVVQLGKLRGAFGAGELELVSRPMSNIITLEAGRAWLAKQGGSR